MAQGRKTRVEESAKAMRGQIAQTRAALTDKVELLRGRILEFTGLSKRKGDKMAKSKSSKQSAASKGATARGKKSAVKKSTAMAGGSKRSSSAKSAASRGKAKKKSGSIVTAAKKVLGRVAKRAAMGAVEGAVEEIIEEVDELEGKKTGGSKNSAGR